MVEFICSEYNIALEKLAKETFPSAKIHRCESHGLDGTTISLIISGIALTLQTIDFFLNHVYPKKFTIIINKRKYLFDNSMSKEEIKDIVENIVDTELHD